jgi:hypothetical protein
MPKKARSYYDVGVYRLLYLLRSRPDHSSLPTRTLVIVNGEADWSGRPKPPEPPREDDLYDASTDLNNYFRARHEVDRYNQLWPAIPKKIFRRCLRHGWLAEKDGHYHLTEAGLAEWESLRDIMKNTPWGYRSRYATVFSRYRRRQQKREQRAAYWISWYEKEGRDIASLLPSFKLSPRAERKLLRRYMSHRRAAAPPPRTIGRRKGWGERLRQHEVDRKENETWD